jgi:assimilatory nitrate reductase catalytic subunit
VLGIDESVIPRQQAMAYDQIVDAIKEGKIKGLWVIATNSAHSWVRQAEFSEILAKLDFLVVQDLYTTTETAQRADLVLPAAGWGEKEGTFINSERRIGLLKKVVRAPGQALSDFHIFKLIAHFWGCGEMFARWSSPEAAFQLLTQVSRGMPCDMSGIADYEQIDRAGGIQWPLRPDEALVQERRLFEDGLFYTDDQRAKILFEEPRPVPTPTSAEFPFVLLTGRGTSSQWHTQTRTAKSDVLRQLYPAECYVELNPQDAHRLHVAGGDRVRISSPQGAATVVAFVTATVQAGQLFMPMHYRETNLLTFPAFDKYSRQPAYKSCAVQVERA